MISEREKLLRSAQRALLFGVTKTLRFMSLEVRDNTLFVLVYLDDEPSEEDRDIYYGVAGEIEGDFSTLERNEVRIVVTKESYDKIEHLQHLVFARAETD